MIASLSMEEIRRYTLFPWSIKAIDFSTINSMIERFPYFSILYIINSLSRQSNLKVQDQEFSAPVLSNDTLYTWYRIGQLARKKPVVDEVEGSLEISEPVKKEDPSEFIEQDFVASEVTQSEAIIDEVSFSKPKVIIDQVEVPVVQTVYIDRIAKYAKITEVSRFKKVSVFYDEKQEVDETILNPEDELTEFSVWLRSISGQNHTAQEVGENEEVGVTPLLAKSIEALTDNGSDVQLEKVDTRVEASIEEIAPDKHIKKVKKKKSPKVKKKQLVEDLVSQSIIDHEFLISEPFAQLLYQQGYREKAVKVYQKLMTKFPEKSNTFALQIDKINNERR